jgi:hypothetical protein
MTGPEHLELSRDIYPLEAVQRTVEAYSELARFEVEATADVVRVAIHEPDEELADAMADEFLNHALYESVRQHRGGAEL